MSDIQGKPPAPSAAARTLTTQTDPHKLPRVLGLFDGTTIVIGSIIGSGIFLSVSDPAKAFGNFWIIIGFWIAGGIVTLLGSLVLAELAAMMPHAGGPYVYLKESFGRMPAFLWGWTEFTVVRTGSLGALSCGTVIYLNELIPMSMGVQEAMAIGVTVGLSAINMVQTRWGAGVQNLTAVVKMLFLGLVILIPWMIGHDGQANLMSTEPRASEVSLMDAFGMTIVAVLWAYDGWVNIGPVAEEIKKPERNVPLALGIGMAAVIGLYVLAITSYHMALSMKGVAESTAVAADLCRQLMGDNWGVKVAALGVMISTFGAVNSNLLAGPRIYFAMARDGLLPPAIRKVHPRFRTPANAILLQGVWSVALIVIVYAYSNKPKDAFDSLISYVIFGGQIFYAMAVGSVFVLRRKYPDLPRPYKTWGYPYTPAIYLMSFAGVVLLGVIGNWKAVAAGLGLIVVGAIFYLIVKDRKQWRSDEPIPEDLP